MANQKDDSPAKEKKEPKIEVRDLIETMMKIVMESAGADRGALLLERDGEWQMEAYADLGDEGIEVGFPAHTRDPLKTDGGLGVPSSVIHYVLRMQAPVVVREPVRDLRFGQDAYVTSVAPRAILCVPVVNHGRTTGIIYLENNV